MVCAIKNQAIKQTKGNKSQSKYFTTHIFLCPRRWAYSDRPVRLSEIPSHFAFRFFIFWGGQTHLLLI